jgi:large subunit ribosomal protein L1
MTTEKILEAIKKARDTKKRNFKQSFILTINLKNIDLKKPENRIKTEIKLPHLMEKESKIGVFADMLLPQAKSLENVIVIRKDQIESYSKNKKAAKKLAEQCFSFLAEAPLMPLVGKSLGQVLAPKNQMPTPIPATADLKSIIEQRKNVIKIQLKESPTIHLAVGTEDMDDEKIAENIDSIIKVVLSSLPKGKESIKNYIVKLTMGKPIKFTM